MLGGLGSRGAIENALAAVLKGLAAVLGKPGTIGNALASVFEGLAALSRIPGAIGSSLLNAFKALAGSSGSRMASITSFSSSSTFLF